MSTSWFEPQWPAPASVHALVTTRSGGVSPSPYDSFNLATHVGDAQESVATNRARLRSQLPAEPLWLNQVHGVRVANADKFVTGEPADGAVAHAARTVLAVLTADCLPILLCDRSGTAVGVAHAGWRGLAAGVIENALAALQRPPGQVLAFLGPAIGASAYEVGEDVRRAFVEQDDAAGIAFRPGTNGRYFADLYALAGQRLSKAGIMSVFGGQHCTFHEPQRFYSYRRDGITGRMASVIWLEPT